MTLFLSICLALSAALIGIAAAMERSAIRQRINGANGLTFLAATIVSALASLPVALVVWWLGGLPLALGVLAGSALWHWAVWQVMTRWIQSEIDRTVAQDKAKA